MLSLHRYTSNARLSGRLAIFPRQAWLVSGFPLIPLPLSSSLLFLFRLWWLVWMLWFFITKQEKALTDRRNEDGRIREQRETPGLCIPHQDTNKRSRYNYCNSGDVANSRKVGIARSSVSTLVTLPYLFFDFVFFFFGRLDSLVLLSLSPAAFETWRKLGFRIIVGKFRNHWTWTLEKSRSRSRFAFFFFKIFFFLPSLLSQRKCLNKRTEKRER